MNDWELLAVGFKRGVVVPALLWLMIACSVLSWAIIVRTWLSQRHERRGYRQVRLELDRANRADFWLASVSRAASNDAGAPRILRAVVHQHGVIANAPLMSLEGIRVAIKTAVVHEVEHLQQTLPLLATISSVSPYLGLFGTVWGVMDAFGAFGGLDQETAFAQVAPGIAQALVATGIGLAVAIPAAVAYNLFLTRAGRLADSFDLIGEELLARISDSSLLQKG
jgi:biopolymer transport protein TolQ